MSRYEYEFVHQMDDVEDLLERTENPLHRKILANYRRHGLLEVSGRYEEILAPEMTVEEPEYRLFEGGESIILSGMDAVRGFYKSLAETNTLVMWTGRQRLSVADWGFSGDVLFSQFVPGRLMADSVFGSVAADGTGDSRPETGIDPEATYLVRRTLAFVWPYTDDSRLIGEHVYEDSASKTVTKVPPEDVITAEKAVTLLAPVLDKHIP